VRDEPDLVHRPIDACADHEAWTSFATRCNVRLPAKGGIDVVAHVARASHSIGDQQRPGKIGEHVNESMDVHVPEAGNEKFSAAVDDSSVRRHRCRSGRPNETDPVSDNEHGVVWRDRPAYDIHH